MATNAAKYGALSVPEGKLAVRLEAEGECLAMTWSETGVPVSDSERREGFGSVLERAALQSVGGSLSREWLPDGLRIDLQVPMHRLTS